MNRPGLEKSAVLLLSLGEEAAAQVFRYLSPFEVGELGRAMREMGALPRARVEGILDEYEEEALRQTGIGEGADEFLDVALTRALGEERGRQLLARITGGSGEVRQLAWKDPAEVAALLHEQHPQLVAAVLAQLDRAQAAAILEWLPETLRPEILQRLAEWQGAPAEALREMEDWLAHRIQGEAMQKEGPGLAADLLSRLSPAARMEVEAGLMEGSPRVYEQLKAQQLEFQDLARLGGESRMAFFKAVPAQTLLLALKGADPDLIEDMLSRMPDTAARRLRVDLESLGAAKLSDIESAQAEVVGLLRQMAIAGGLELAPLPARQPEEQT